MTRKLDRAVVGPLEATVGLQVAAAPANEGLTGAKMLADMQRRPPCQQPAWMRGTAAESPKGLTFLPSEVTWHEVDQELRQLADRYANEAKVARAQARRHYKRGDLARWRKANAVARAWKSAYEALWMVACPF